MRFEKLAAAYPHIQINEREMPSRLPALYMDGKVYIDKNRTDVEKHCLLAEEIGHAQLTVGNIVKQESVNDWKQESLARRFAFELLIPMSKLIECYEESFTTLHEVADYLHVTEEFLSDALRYYQVKFDKTLDIDGYRIFFEPLNIIKL